MTGEAAVKLCGRWFCAGDLEIVRREIRCADPPLRAEIARRVCQALRWQDCLGRPKLMSCRVALLRLHRAHRIALPPPRNGNGNGKALLRQTVAWPKAEAIVGSVEGLAGLSLERVQAGARSALWNGLIDRYHYLGYRPLAGAQLRYLIVSGDGVLGALGFGAAAWKVAVRDHWIGWDAATRERGLSRLVNNARFLILPWVRVHNLASRVLSLAARRVAEDFETAYGVRPVLLETFVESRRHVGTCYRAANWIALGQTTGRGKGDRDRTAALLRKAVYVYPLVADFRRRLGVVA
jgi:hypothetical protein